MKLNVLKRTLLKKSESKKIRYEGNIPAVLYVHGKNTETIIVKGAEFTALMRSVQTGRLSTTVFTLIDSNGKERRAVIKEIQYEPTTYKVHHLDFEELYNDVTVQVKVPIECVGMADCAGIKLGGVLRQVIRTLRVRCLPKDMPSVFQIDVRDLALYETKRLSDLSLPNTVKALADLNEVAVVIAKR